MHRKDGTSPSSEVWNQVIIDNYFELCLHGILKRITPVI